MMRRTTPWPCGLAGRRSGNSAEDKAQCSWKFRRCSGGWRAGGRCGGVTSRGAAWCTLRVHKNSAGWRGLQVRQGPRSVPKTTSWAEVFAGRRGTAHARRPARSPADMARAGRHMAAASPRRACVGRCSLLQHAQKSVRAVGRGGLRRRRGGAGDAVPLVVSEDAVGLCRSSASVAASPLKSSSCTPASQLIPNLTGD